MSDVNELLARLKMPSATESGQLPESSSARSTSASALHHPQPHSASLLHSFTASPPPVRGNSLSPAQGDDRAASDRTASLLNLLKFNQNPPAASSSQPTGAPNQSTPQHALSTSTDLKIPSSQNISSLGNTRDHSSSSPNPSQDALLKLLTRSSAQAQSDPTGQLDVEKDTKELPTASAEPKQEPDESPAGQDDTELAAIAKLVSEQEDQPLVDVQEAVEEVAAELQQELKREDSELRQSMPAPMAAAFEETIDKVVDQAVAAAADDSQVGPSAGQESEDSLADQEPRVFQFPMRPFVAIHIDSSHQPARRVREDLVIKIASLKREFDQVDRTLAAATSNFIVYAMLNSKGGGIRLIRQDEGTSNHIFKKSGASMFNVAISSPKGSGSPDLILSTDVNGSVYWTVASASEVHDNFSEHNFENKSFIFPPLPSQEDNTSGAQLKTRAKLSSRHPDFFAVGRGKSIHIVRPYVAMSIDAPYINPVTRIVNSEKYLADQCLKIATGKAGKDFTFSEDDTVIVSLDKAGRLKFWDIRLQTDVSTASLKAKSHQHIETRNPLLTLTTCAPNEKSWATSVQFLDKERPMAKGLALRYMVVGSKQNHTLHLWDLGLGKPVQEVNFPHENEMDAICSVVYHPKTAILTVGHPTRNSIYLIHVSAPRYNIPTAMTQAEFVQKISEKSPSLPAPESTAIMSGMREISLSSIGQLRSLSVLSVPMSTASSEEVESVLELYIMHSKGLTSLTLTRQDIGIGMDGKPIYPVDALATGRVTIYDLKAPPSMDNPYSSETSSRSEVESKKDSKDTSAEMTKAARTSPKPKPQASKGAMSPPVRPVPSEETQTNREMPGATPAPIPEILPRDSKVESQLAGPQPSEPPAIAAEVPISVEETSQAAAASARSEMHRRKVDDLSQDVAGLEVENVRRLGEAISGAVGGTIADVFAKVLGEQLGSLHRRIDEDKRVQEAAGAAKQDAILRLVSSTLTENVEQSLTRIITTNVRDSVVPAVSADVRASVDSKVSDALGQHLQTVVAREVKGALPAAISKSLQDPELLRKISGLVSAKVADHVERVFTTTLETSITPAFRTLSMDAVQHVGQELQTHVTKQIQHVDTQSRGYSAKIDQLAALNTELFETVKIMANNQSLMQQELSELRAELKHTSETPTTSSRAGGVVEPVKPERDAETDEIAALMTTGRFEEGTIKWLQSARQAEIFDKLFVQMNPSYLRSCNQIVVLSVSAAVTATLDSYLAERLSWLESALSVIDTRSVEIADHVSGVMDALTQRLQDSYMSIAEATPSNPILAKIHALVRQAKETKALISR